MTEEELLSFLGQRISVDSLIADELETYRISEALFAQAYTRTDLHHRALIKKQIAWLWSYGNQGCFPPRIVTHTDANFCRNETVRRPADWVLIFVHPEFSSPIRLVAAILPAVLAAVPSIAVVRQKGKRRFPHSLLTALELSGIEDVFQPPQSICRSFITRVKILAGHGRILFLGPWKSDQYRAVLSTQGIRCWQEPNPVLLGLSSGPDRKWSEEDLAFAHGKIPIFRIDRQDVWSECLPHGECLDFSGFFWPQKNVPEWLIRRADLVLGPGGESLWCWPALGPDWFLNRSLAVLSEG